MLPSPFIFIFSSFTLSLAYTSAPRWAQAVAVINDALFVYGGKTDPYNAYGYNAAPWNNDLLYLSLSAPFDPSNPPWQYISGSVNSSISSQGPALAWHTLSAFNTSTCLIFGGSTGPVSGIVLLDNDDSAQFLNVAHLTSPTFLSFPNHWAGEPQRRIRHATASRDGKIYIIGGEAADGSGNAFSTHFVFLPSVPAFVQLPSDSGPPGIFGHAAVILFDGRLLVFGGISQGQLVPLNVIWVLDTTQSNLTWILASIDSSNLPSPRASFAFVLLDDGRILIQGGTDALFQSNFADGWILDPSKSPMTWTPIPALSQVGPRRDHFACNAAGQVVFGFGFGDDAPADPAMTVYNVGASTFQPTFSPMTAPPSHTTLPPNPSQTITNPPGSSQTSANGNPSNQTRPGQSGISGSNSGSRTGGPPSSTSTGLGGSNGPGGSGLGGTDKDTAAIAIGTVLGALGLIAGIALIVWYLRRRHRRSGHAFSALDGDEEHPHSITAIRIGDTRGTGSRILAMPLALLSRIGIGHSRRHMDSRRDILADEDRSIDWVGVSREGSAGRSSYGGRSARNSIREFSNVVTESIRNLARGASSTSRSRAPSKGDWEKMGGDPFSPEVALMAEGLARGELPERTRDGFPLAGPSRPYTDPFAERDASSEVLRDDASESEPESSRPPERREHYPPQSRLTPLRTALPPSSDFVPLSPLVEQASQNSLSNSSTSHNADSDLYAGSGSLSSRGVARSPRPSSILDPNPPLNEPIRRSNSWWSRFTNTSLLERRGTESSARSSGGFLDIRDPNPPPRLLPIEESTHSRDPSDAPADATRFLLPKPTVSFTANRALSGSPSRRPSLYHHETVHGRSASSLQTANTEMLERVGGTMDIIQRDGTVDSQHTPLTGTYSLDDEFGIVAGGRAGSGGPHQLRALLVRGESSYHSTGTGSSSASTESPMVLSPVTSGPVTPTGELPEPISPPPEEAGTGSAEGILGEDGGPDSPAVAERVRLFERRMSRENAPPPPPTNTRRREERSAPTVAVRPPVRYGLVPRASLFVANPDGSRGSDGG
ncbi:hypothetical protein F5148DRAFT_1286788 [Russula earlei]|uniref:Uncharacterized protein n=1 Tax=Russula earlei TaxID=71964 RepID=A0ACC0U5L5_9AGAM|nr:hypothetical protein F5148DRAFT_1286788 [Russula earlei]